VPLYEYECQKCGHRFERIQLYSEKPIRKCPKCKKGKVVKLPSAPAVQFKGTGWYVTDYGRKGTSSALPEHGDKGKEGDDKAPDKKESAKETGSGGKETSGKGGSGKKGSRKD